MRFIPSRKALWTNFTEALGYCSSQVPKINFDECAIPTSDPDILDLNNCGIKDKEGRSVCNPDGIRDGWFIFIAHLSVPLSLIHLWYVRTVKKTNGKRKGSKWDILDIL